MNSNIEKKVGEYYTEKIKTHGTSSQGVDWNGQKSHFLRFEQLVRILQSDCKFSILDYGCGFGSLIEFLSSKNYVFEYTGFDISNEMLIHGRKSFPEFRFVNQIDEGNFDFTIANGIFNVKLDTSNEDWKKYIFQTLDEINTFSKRGFSFNVLSSYSDQEYMQDYLFYADPLEIFDYCKLNFSKNVSLIHDYNLYEFTILVKK